jgi:hypothetical protein
MTKTTICCQEFLDITIRATQTKVSTIWESIEAALSAGLPINAPLLVAIAVGHRILKHDDNLVTAMRFAQHLSSPSVQVRAATAADIINDCDVNMELAIKMIETGASLSDDVTREIKEMAEVAKLPDTLSPPQMIICLHSIKAHGSSLDEAMLLMATDSMFSQLEMQHRPN